MKFKELELILGLIRNVTQDTGSIIKCTVKDTFSGLMASNISEVSKKINAMVKESSFGKTDESTTDNGFVESKVVSVCIQTILEINAKEFGKMEKGKNGLIPEFKGSFYRFRQLTHYFNPFLTIFNC